MCIKLFKVCPQTSVSQPLPVLVEWRPLAVVSGVYFLSDIAIPFRYTLYAAYVCVR
jgi:hypothetical protein